MDVSVAPKASGITTVIDTITAPGEAFERLRVAPTWGWALVIALVLMLAGAFLQGPAVRHAAVAQTQRMVANSTLLANATQAQKQQMVENAGKTSPFSYIGPVVGLFLAVFFNTLVMLVGSAVGRGQADFKRLWCGSMNIAVPTLGLGALVLGAITSLRGPDAFSNSIQIAQAIPGLGALVPHASPVTSAFLSGISLFTLWGAFLNATMLRQMAKTSAPVAYTFAAIVLLLGAAIPAAGAMFFQKFGLM